MTVFEFIQWCFRSPLAGLVTIIVLVVVFDGLAKIALGLRGRE